MLARMGVSDGGIVNTDYKDTPEHKCVACGGRNNCIFKDIKLQTFHANYKMNKSWVFLHFVLHSILMPFVVKLHQLPQ